VNIDAKMNWLQDGLMMSSQVSSSLPPLPSDPSLVQQLHARIASPISSSPAQLPYEARISLNPMQYPGGVQYPQSPFTANLNFNLINNAFKPSKEMQEQLPSPSPSSASGSPRTDEGGDRDPSSEPGPSSEPEPPVLSGLEIMRQQIQQIPEMLGPARPGLSVRKDMVEGTGEKVEENAMEIHDVEEESRIDEEMADEGNESLEQPIDDSFVEDKAEDTSRGEAVPPFVGFQPYLQPRPGAPEEAGSSLEKLQQVGASVLIILMWCPKRSLAFYDCEFIRTFYYVKVKCISSRQVHCTLSKDHVLPYRILNAYGYYCDWFSLKCKSYHYRISTVVEM
jgi:hypothetical protein